MTFVPANFDDAQEARPAKPGKYALQITKAEEVLTGPNSKHPGMPQLRVTLGFQNEPNTPDVTQFISLPHEFDENPTFKTLLLKRFLEHFKIPYDRNGIDTEKVCMEAVGCSAVTEVGLSEPDANGNVYNRVVIPRLRDEPNSRR